jgi:hypothetical protein
MGENGELLFEYISGRSFEARLVEVLVLKDRAALLTILQEYAHLVAHIGAVAEKPIAEIFGVAVNLPDELCLNTANIDLSFANVFCLDAPGEYAVIDYEWVFEDIPVSYILFRSVYHLYNQYTDYLAPYFTLEQLLESVGVTSQHSSLYLKVEQAFQQHVYGQEQLYRVQDGFLQANEYLSSILSKSQSVAKLEEWGKEQEAALKQRDEAILEQQRSIEEISEWNKQQEQALRSRDDIILKQQQSIQEVSDWGRKVNEQNQAQLQTIGGLQQYITAYHNSRGYKFLCKCYAVRDFLRKMFRFFK